MTASHLSTCGWPDQDDDPGGLPALVWIHLGAPDPVTSAITALPDGWLCLGTAFAPDPSAATSYLLSLEFAEIYDSARDKARVGNIVELVLDVVDDTQHVRFWAPRAELRPGWEFRLHPDCGGVASQLFIGPEVRP